MKSGSITKYKFGLLAIAIFTVALLIAVIIQAGPTKQDTQTYNKATNIANSLNNYIDTNGIIPNTLGDAGIYNIPSTVSYQPNPDGNSYKFCVDYKTTSSGFDSANVAGDLVTSSEGGGSGGNYTNNTDLYINTSHKKGENCQTIYPSYLNNIYNNQNNQNNYNNTYNTD